MRRRWPLLPGLLLALLPGTACTAQPSTPDPEQAEADADVTASVVQLRFEEGSTRLHVRVVNTGADIVEVARAGLAGPSLRSAPTPPVVRESGLIAPGEMMTAPGTFEPPDCSHEGEPAVASVVLADGRQLQAAVDGAGQLVVDQIVARLCIVERVAQSVDLRLLPDWQRTTVGGRPALAGTLAMDRVPDGSGADVRVTLLLGSVLVNLAAADGWLPVEVADAPVRVPVTLSPTGRCDPHALAESKQTFQLSTYVELDGAPEQRLITVPDLRTQRRVQQLIRVACGLVD